MIIAVYVVVAAAAAVAVAIYVATTIVADFLVILVLHRENPSVIKL